MRNLVLFDEPNIREQLYPVSLTRCIGEIRVGIGTIMEKWQHFLEGSVSSMTESYLQEKYGIFVADDNWFIASHILPNQELATSILDLKPRESLFHGRQLLSYRGPDWKGRIENRIIKEYKGYLTCIQFPFNVFQLNEDQILSDLTWYTSGRKSMPVPPDTIILGGYPVFLEAGASLSACILNAQAGPIYIGKGATVMEGSCIRGPFAMLDNAEVRMGSKIYGATTLGPYSVVGGEVKNSVFFSHSNKPHDGYIGDAVIGEWCNLGANTNCSNLKNNVGPIRIWNQAARSYIPAGTKCGVIMGDFTRCGISTMLNTGTVIGVSCNIFGGDFPPKHIPSFSWGGAAKWMKYELEKALKDAGVWMEMKKKTMSRAEEIIFRHIYSNLSDYP